MARTLLLPTLIIGWVFILYEYAIRVSDSVIIDRLMHFLHIGPGQIGILSSAYYIPYVLMQIPAGLMIDRLGIRRSWPFALLLVAVGSIIFSHSHHLSFAIIGRILMGIGSAYAWVGAIKIIYRLPVGRNHAFFIGISMTLCMVGAVLGQAPWLYLTNLLGSWQLPYAYAGLLGLLLSAVVYFLATDVQTNSTSNPQLKTILKSLKPLMIKPHFWLLVIYLAAISLPQNAFTALWAAEFFKRSYHFSAETAASLLALIWFGGLAGAPIMGFLSDRIDDQRNLLINVGIITLILMLIIIFVQPDSILLIAILLFLIGFITNASVAVYALAAKMAADISTSSIIGVANMVNMGMAAIVQMISGWVLSATMQPGTIGNFYWALSVIPILLALSTISIFFIRKPQ